METIFVSNEPKTVDPLNVSWTIFEPGRAFSCDVAIVQEDDGFSAFAEMLPGAVSQGDTIEEATENIKDALREVISEYQHSQRPIPWNDSPAEGEVVCRKRIMVNV